MGSDHAQSPAGKKKKGLAIVLARSGTCVLAEIVGGACPPP